MKRRPVETNRTSPIPREAIELVAQISDRLGMKTQAGVRIEVSLQNTIEMKHLYQVEPDLIRVVLDWSVFERVLMLGKFFWGMNGGRLWRQKITGFFEQEVFLVASRFACLHRQFGVARNLLQMYRDFEFADIIEHKVDIEEQAQEFGWYVLFALHRELGRPLVKSNWQTAVAEFCEVFPDAQTAGMPDPQTLTETYLDRSGVFALRRLDGDALGKSAIAELVLYAAIEDLVRTVELVAPHIDGYSDAYEAALQRAWRLDRTWRYQLLEGLSVHFASDYSDPSKAERVSSCARVAREYLPLLDNGLRFGLPRLRHADWIHMKSLSSEEGLEMTLVDETRGREIHAEILALVDK